MTKLLQILLVDEHEVVRLGLKALLSRYSHFEVVGEANNGKDAKDLAEEHTPDVIVMDARLPGKSGLQAAREILEMMPDVGIIILTSQDNESLLFEAIRAGVSAYLLKQIGSEDLIAAIESVGRGDAYLDPKLTRLVFKRVREAERQATRRAFEILSPQELRILALVTQGKSNKKIGYILHLADGTVRNYLSNLMQKLKVSNRAAAAAFAAQHKIYDYMPTERKVD
jgi:DNA-binding NarL/FixJ family response regulator